jgi:hypothetical protein
MNKEAAWAENRNAAGLVQQCDRAETQRLLIHPSPTINLGLLNKLLYGFHSNGRQPPALSHLPNSLMPASAGDASLLLFPLQYVLQLLDIGG